MTASIVLSASAVVILVVEFTRQIRLPLLSFKSMIKLLWRYSNLKLRSGLVPGVSAKGPNASLNNPSIQYFVFDLLLVSRSSNLALTKSKGFVNSKVTLLVVFYFNTLTPCIQRHQKQERPIAHRLHMAKVAINERGANRKTLLV
jgi:hypothetical protein